MQTRNQPRLAEVSLATVWPPRPGLSYMTLSPGQWDSTLDAAYQLGYILVEIDGNEQPSRAFRTPQRN